MEEKKEKKWMSAGHSEGGLIAESTWIVSQADLSYFSQRKDYLRIGDFFCAWPNER